MWCYCKRWLHWRQTLRSHWLTLFPVYCSLYLMLVDQGTSSQRFLWHSACLPGAMLPTRMIMDSTVWHNMSPIESFFSKLPWPWYHIIASEKYLRQTPFIISNDMTSCWLLHLQIQLNISAFSLYLRTLI